MMVYFLWIACILLLCVCVYLSIKLYSIKKQLRGMKAELPLTKQKGYNRQLTVALIDKDVTALAAETNRNLDFQKQLKLKTEEIERNMKRSVSDIAHDLRTPLTVINGNLQMLESSEQLSAKGREQVRICMSKTELMKQMADDFFELSLLESDNTDVKLSRTDLTSVLVEFILDSEAVITCSGTEPDICIPEKSLYIMADATLLQRMLSNLLNNILKHSKGSFMLSLAEEDDGIRLTFANPVRPDQTLDVQRLFDRTYRGDKSRHGSGAGLGLYIVKLLAEIQNATVSAAVSGDILSISILFSKA